MKAVSIARCLLLGFIYVSACGCIDVAEDDAGNSGLQSNTGAAAPAQPVGTSKPSSLRRASGGMAAESGPQTGAGSTNGQPMLRRRFESSNIPLVDDPNEPTRQEDGGHAATGERNGQKKDLNAQPAMGRTTSVDGPGTFWDAGAGGILIERIVIDPKLRERVKEILINPRERSFYTSRSNWAVLVHVSNLKTTHAFGKRVRSRIGTVPGGASRPILCTVGADGEWRGVINGLQSLSGKYANGFRSQNGQTRVLRWAAVFGEANEGLWVRAPANDVRDPRVIAIMKSQPGRWSEVTLQFASNGAIRVYRLPKAETSLIYVIDRRETALGTVDVSVGTK